MAEASLAAMLRPVGGFMAMCLDTFRLLFRRPFYWREFVEQVAFIAGVSLFPAIMLIIPLAGLVVFVLLQLFAEIGGTDLAGAASGLAIVREVGPIASVLVVAGAGATAVCADLGARTIREEIDAMQVLGINPIHRLVVPRVLASTVVAMLLNGVASVVGLGVCYAFSVLVFHSSAGQFVATLPLLSGLDELVLSETKAAVYGMAAGLVACYRGLAVRGGPKAVGEAVNQTVILSFVLLFLFNVLLTMAFIANQLVD
ncbi:MAG TPA: ABC transporter permease [Pseudonocardia sp.]|jgi:phospholipid/cholesterol/gamma-HCH transport system permease protein